MRLSPMRPAYRWRLLAGLTLFVFGPIAVHFTIAVDRWRTIGYFATVVAAPALVLWHD